MRRAWASVGPSVSSLVDDTTGPPSSEIGSKTRKSSPRILCAFSQSSRPLAGMLVKSRDSLGSSEVGSTGGCVAAVLDVMGSLNSCSSFCSAAAFCDWCCFERAALIAFFFLLEVFFFAIVGYMCEDVGLGGLWNRRIWQRVKISKRFSL